MSQDLPRLTLYHRAGCHLCEEMLEGLAPWSEQLRLRLVDVDSGRETQQRYGQLVPVLAGPDGVEICRYFLDGERLELARWLADYYAVPLGEIAPLFHPPAPGTRARRARPRAR